MGFLFFKKNSVKQKIIGYFLGIMLCVTFLIVFVTVSRARQKLIIGQENKAQIVSSNLAIASGDPMMVGEWDRLEQLLKEVKKNDADVEYAILLGNDGKCVASSVEGLKDKFLKKNDFEKGALDIKELTMRKNPEQKDVFEIVVPVMAAGQKMGTLRMGYTTKYISAVVANTVFVSFVIGFLALVVGSSIYYFMIQKGIVGPLSKLITAVETLASRAGDLTQKISIYTKDEIERLAEAFNKMLDSLHDLVFQVRATSEKVASSAQQMSSSTQEINASTQEVSGAIQQVNKGATIQAQRVEETFEIMEKTAISLKQMVANAQAASSAVSQTSNRAETGRAAAVETVEKISRLTNTVVETAKVIQGLGEKSQQIGEITETITSIADQTNLLALNAAIEAARAGEAGRGFAVVAEEVRKLAESSAEAVRKIGGLIRSIQTETNRAVSSIEASSKEVQEGRTQVSKIADILLEINKAAQEANILANEIATSGQKQVQETERVVKAINEVAAIAKDSVATVEQVSSSTQEQTASMQEMSASSQELARLATDLKDLVGKFKLRDKI